MSTMVHSLTGESATVESDTCPASSTGQTEPLACAVPTGKRSAWDHCSLTDLGAFPHFDFHEVNRTCSEVT